MAGDHNHSHHDDCSHPFLASWFGNQAELIFAVSSGVVLLAGVLLAWLTESPEWLPRTMFQVSCVLGATFIAGEAFQKTLQGKFEIDFLMIVAAIGAGVLGAWAEAAFLLFLFSLGHALEHYALGKARTAISSLADLAPTTATVIEKGVAREVDVVDLAVGDVILVKTSERIAADGFVIDGESSVDQAPVTGESAPVDKLPVDDLQAATANPERLSDLHRVFAGTFNQQGTLQVQVTQTSTDSVLARVVRMVQEAESRKSQTQQFADRFQKAYVPAVITVVVLLNFAFVLVDESIADSFYRAMAVLVAASPCALAISTPSAVLSGIARAARGGILIKGGAPLEMLGTIDSIAFDKTGTLTQGKLRITDVIPVDGVTESQLLQIVVEVERAVDHPLAIAIVQDGSQRLSELAEAGEVRSTPDVTELESAVGMGVIARVDGKTVRIGKPNWFDGSAGGPALSSSMRSRVEECQAAGRTTIVVFLEDRCLGILGLMDTVRPEARNTLQQLGNLGIQRLMVLSGDNQLVVDAIAEEIGLSSARGNLMPRDKVEAIQKEEQHHTVAMVGDGVNDAAAIANANIGIAMGAAGTDLALESADVALMADDLSRLPFAIRLGRQTGRIIRQNLWISLGMVALLVPATLFGLRLGWAVLLHEGSTVVVVFNALRLLVYKE